MNQKKLDSVEDAIKDIREGKVVIVVDDEDRENEGDFICAAETITPEIVNFMATHGRGLICTPIEEDKADALDLPLMVNKNTALHETAFTVSIDLEGHGVTTGISASDRAKTIRHLASAKCVGSDFARPGHIFPLRAKKGGVLRRTGHTEASIDLARLAGLAPIGVLVEIMNEDGSMARLHDLWEIASKHNLKIISIEDLVAYRMKHESIVQEIYHTAISSPYGDFKVVAFEQITSSDIHLALIKGNIEESTSVPVRMHSVIAGEQLFNSLTDRESPIDAALKVIKDLPTGILVIMRQNERNFDLIQRLKELDGKAPTVFTRSEVQKDFGVGAQILRKLKAKRIELISNNPRKLVGLEGYGLEIVGYRAYNGKGR